MKLKKLTAALTAILCCAGTLTMFPEVTSHASVEAVGNSFERSYEGWISQNAQLTAVDGAGYLDSRGMVVSGRQNPTDGASSSKGFYLIGGVAYTYNVKVMSETDQTFHLSVLTKDEATDAETYQEILTKDVKAGVWTDLSATYTAPDNSYEFQVTITNDSTEDFAFDEVSITSEKPVNIASAAASDKGLKDEFAPYFRVGNILNGGTVKNSAITGTFLKDYNAVECENETKPDATLVQNGSTNTDIKVSLNSCAAIADFASKNNLAFRGHTMVWHSQTPSWFFHENFNANAGWVSKDVMNQRLESYIKNMFNAFKTQYPDLNLYAYDICNECVSDDANRTKNYGGAREPGDSKIQGQGGKSAWVQVYGDNSFVEKAFTYARKYAPEGCQLYYNDYNEYWDHKRDCIYNMCKSLYQKGVLDGVGMQSHINANYGGFSGVDAYVTAMKKYLSIGCDVQITELDISRENGTYSDTDQSNKYTAIFKAAMDWNKNPQSDGRVTLVQIWGPNDANTWIKTENAPLLYDTNNQPKAAYKALTSMIPQSEWGDGSNPAGAGDVTPVEPNEFGWFFDCGFEGGTDGWESRGGTTLTSSSDEHYVGSSSMYVSGRTSAWNGANYSLSSRTFEPGKSYAFSTHVKYTSGPETDEFCFSIQYEDASGEVVYDKIDTATVPKGKWVQLQNSSFKIPEGAKNVIIYVETADSTTSFYVDEVIGAVDGTGFAGEGKPTNLGPTKRVKGDLDGDGVMDVFDLALAKRGLVSGFVNSIAEKNADIDENGKAEVSDIVQMAKFLVGKIDKFEVVEKVGPEYEDMSAKFANYMATGSWKKEGENNPLTTQRFGADPGWMVYDGRLYIYTTNDAFEYNGNGQIQDNTYNSGTINCVSTADMVNWTDHGAIPVADKNGRTQNGAAKWAFAAWAPDAAWKMINGKPKFFLYFANSGGGIGVLTADSPTGPWSDPLGHALLTGQSPNCSDVVWMFDPGVYYDEKTDEAYLFFGGGRDDKKATPDAPGTGRVVKLGKDMISLDGNPVKMETPYLFEESSVIKIGDTWYYSYCANWNVPNGCNINGNSFGSADICYMTSKNPLGPWNKSTFSGMVFGNTGAQGIDKGGNNHHSIIYFKDKYYVAYHSRQQALRMDAAHDGKDHNYRSTQINEATFNPSTGKITCKGDMVGVKQIETLNPYTTVGAETMNNQSKNVQVQGLGDTVVVAKANDWTKVSGVKFEGLTGIKVKASSANGATIRMTVGGVNGDVVSYINVPAGGSMTEIEAGVADKNLSGTKDVYFSFNGDVTFDSWEAEQ
ncbi:MAG: endo-1,4-beta-xylanase [Oscillospiraceae bacterium]|nr:endo-1,4-beta-xylanase [Oscillospiraceae bacterium]